jgi:rubrerythrin
MVDSLVDFASSDILFLLITALAAAMSTSALAALYFSLKRRDLQKELAQLERIEKVMDLQEKMASSSGRAIVVTEDIVEMVKELIEQQKGLAQRVEELEKRLEQQEAGGDPNEINL